MNYTISEPISFRDFLELCKKDDAIVTWVVFEDQHKEYNFDMKMFPVTLNGDDLTDDEYEVIENEVTSKGFSNALHSNLIVDVMYNLEHQKANYTDDELLLAINFYSQRDAFLDITTP